jgi:spore germination protein GerM
VRRSAVALVALAVLAAGCGLPEDERPRLVTADEAPIALGGEAPEAATVAPGETRARLYFFDADGVLFAVQYPVADSNDPKLALMNALEALLIGPNDADDDLHSALPVDLTIISVDITDTVATIDLGASAEGGINSVVGIVLVQAFAQLVFTATEIDPVEAVRFTNNGLPQDAFTDVEAPSSEPVTRDDYASLIAGGGG